MTCHWLLIKCGNHHGTICFSKNGNTFLRGSQPLCMHSTLRFKITHLNKALVNTSTSPVVMHSPFPSFPSRGSFLKWMPCMSVCASPPAFTAHITRSARLGPPPSAQHRYNSSDSTAVPSQAAQGAVARCVAMRSLVLGRREKHSLCRCPLELDD